MLQPRISATLRRALFNGPSLCIRCQRQAFGRPQSFQIRNTQRQFTSATTLRRPEEPPQPPKEEPEEEGEFVPQPLGRPIGFPWPPKAGENTGEKTKKVYTGSTLSERNLEKRKDIVEAWGKNYFRDFKNVRKYRKGKTFMANPRVFRADLALYFPNLHGETLESKDRDTTPVLKGKISVVNVYSSNWGLQQSESFTSSKANPALHEVLKSYKDKAQMVEINIEENVLKAWIIDLFKYRLRKEREMEDWGKYFIVRKGVDDRIRETIGLLNGKVGYVYLLDEQCKIRWAGSGDAEGTEKEDLVKGLQKLLKDSELLRLKAKDTVAQIRAQRDAGPRKDIKRPA